MTMLLNVLIVGGGLGGLAAAIALKQKGHHVTVLEAAAKLGEVGAGIQVPPNCVRHLSRLGVADKVGNESTSPASITIKRWKNGNVIGATPLRPTVEEAYGYPYWLIHRADFHKILHERAIEVGVIFQVNSHVTSVDASVPMVILKDGRTLQADVIIGADGVKSSTRRCVITDHEVGMTADLCCVYRCLVPGDAMYNDPELRPFMESPNASWWVGPGGHVMAYPIRKGKIYNFNLTHMGPVSSGMMVEAVTPDEIIKRYEGWDPKIVRILEKNPNCSKWQLLELEKIPTWVSESGKVALMGDAAHAMLPFLAQGAAMAIEDAVVLAECLSSAESLSDIPQLLRLYEQLRMDRVHIVTDGARETVFTWHLPDGPEQEARDAKLLESAPAEKADKQSSEPGPGVGTTLKVTLKNPNSWSDPSFQPWLFGFDAVADAQAQIAKKYVPSRSVSGDQSATILTGRL